jgi:hypothetical protein
MLITVQILNDFLSKFDVHYDKKLLKADKIKLAKNIIEKYKIPQRYLTGLTPDEIFLRQIEILSKKRMTKTQRYKTPLITDKIARQKSIQNKSSSCTNRLKNIYKHVNNNKDKSKVTGIPIHILNKVDNKGRGAFYSSGSRPGQNAHSWGATRVNCFIMNKPTVTNGPDKHLYLEALKSPRARRWFENTRW